MSSSGGDGISVVHVDDDAAFTELAATFLEREDDQFDVETSTSARDGLKRLTDDVDCVISDYDMPGMSGLEFLEAVRDEYPDLPFILYTGKGSEEVASEAISAGVTDYLQKERGSSQYAVLANRIENAVDRYRTQQRLAAEKNQYQRLFEQAPVMYAVTRNRDGEPIIETCNQKFVDCLGYDREDVVGESLVTFYSDESMTAFRDGGYQRALSGEFVTEERTFVTADGNEVETLLRAVPRADEEGETVGTLILSLDITDRKERQRELSRTKNQLELALEAANLGVYDWNVQTDEITFNDQVAELLGFSKAEFDQDAYFWKKRTHPDDLDPIEEAHEKLFQGATDFCRNEYRIRSKEGDWKWVQSLGRIVDRDESGEAIRMIGIHQDITGRKERERELKRQNERLDEFASVVSHDLRNPLNVAMGHLETVQTDCENDHLDEVAQAHDQMASLIDDLLTLARRGDTIEDAEPIDLAPLVERCWRTVETADATLVLETDRTISADPARAKQLLENLVRNAVEHGGDDVTVTIGHLDARPGFYVADDGPGIPDGERDCVLETGYTAQQAGTGLGLSIAHQIATAHGWEVTVTDSEDGGARFEITGVDTEQ